MRLGTSVFVVSSLSGVGAAMASGVRRTAAAVAESMLTAAAALLR